MRMETQLYQASRLAMNIKATGIMDCAGGSSKGFYDGAGFTGEVHSFVGGAGDVHAGLCGIIQLTTEQSGTEQCLVLAFRGTNSTVYDWMNNFTCAFETVRGHGRVHKGFWEAVQSIYPGITQYAASLVKSAKPGKFYITGHSKGGAMASLMAVMLENGGIPGAPKPEVVTFASPRVGDAAFVRSYPVPNIRYESCRDLVPHVPLTEQEAALIAGMEITIVGEEAAGDAAAPSPIDYIKRVVAVLQSLAEKNLAQFAPLGTLRSIVPAGESEALGESSVETVHTLYNVMTRVVLKLHLKDIDTYHNKDYENEFI